MTEGNKNIILKKCMNRTWSTFFGRFGRLLPIQISALSLVLQEKNAIIISSTASGKTEAVVAPLCERILKNKIEGLSVIYITPTKALANDLFERLNEQMSELNLKILVKTGDKPQINIQKLPNFLITTPESLDSIICRHPSILKNIKSIVIDEIHNIDNKHRGDQTRILLKRLRLIAGEYSIYALSATVNEPLEVAKRYMNNFHIVQTNGLREIKETYVFSFEEILEIAKIEHLYKILVFCNSRKKTEETGVTLKNILNKYKVVVHHGSLSKYEREEAECFMKESRHAVCVSTMTLEIGIDIGSIDAVVLAEVPWDVESFIQRIGRAGRRTGIIRVFLLCNNKSKKTFEFMIDCAKKNTLESKPYHPDLSVLVQQIFSVLYSNQKGVNEDYFYDLFDDFCSYEEVKKIIENLIESGYLIKKNKKICATEEIINLGDRGYIHSNIPTLKTVEVVNSITGRKIGEIQLSIEFIESYPSFTLAGRFWDIVKRKEGKVYVKESSMSTVYVKFKTNSQLGAFFKYLPEEIQGSELEKRS